MARALDLLLAAMIGGPVRAVLTGAGALALLAWLLGWQATLVIIGALLVGAAWDLRRWPRIWRPW